ncbi:MAG: class I SAM-dependent methyltransferase [Labilithrix sp.]|nr:class I SAM-dependent methyltransferase [Labilithrix sp.]MCW5810526.1 class I SAM-dependent methyltransferase [Labilithrix sp.]
MPHLWETVFAKHKTVWGSEPTRSALLARDLFVERGARSVLLPGAGYGRNAKPFLDAGMAVTGIEVSETAIALARSQLGLDFPIHHGSVTDMPFDDRTYDAVFCFGLLYLLDPPARTKLLADCARQLAPNGAMVFTLIAKDAEMYGRGRKLGDDWYETEPGMRLFFYDEVTVERDFGPYGLVRCTPIDEPMHNGTLRPFLHVVCTRA